MLCILKAILGYAILLFVGTNLIGFIFRGIMQVSQKPNAGNPAYYGGLSKPISSIIFLLFGLFASLLYLYALYYFWNIGVVIAATMLMLARLPDLILEIRTGEKISFKTMPKKPLDILCTIVLWLALPVLWYSLCYWAS